MQKQLEQFHIPSPLLSNPGPHLPVRTPILPNSHLPATVNSLPPLSTGLHSQQPQRLTMASKEFCPPVCSTSNLDKALEAFFPEGIPASAQAPQAPSVKEKNDMEVFGADGQSEKMEQLLRGEGDGGEASRPTSRPASPTKSPSLEGGDDAVVNDPTEVEVQDMTRRVVEVSIDGETEEEELGDQTKAVDPDMALERCFRKEERISSRDCPNVRRTVPSSQDVRVQPLFTKQTSAAARGGGQIGKHHQKAPDGQSQAGRIRFGGERLAEKQQSSKHRAAEELDFRQLREELEADIEKFSKAASNAPAGMVVKGISRCFDPPQMEGRQFAKGPRPTEGQEEQHASNVRGGFAEPEARHPMFPSASSVRPSPSLPTVDLPVMLSSRYSSLNIVAKRLFQCF